jgi:hypothetical protein
MRSLLPILSVILALIAAGSIVYIAWELSSGRIGSDGADEADPKTPNRRRDSSDEDET